MKTSAPAYGRARQPMRCVRYCVRSSGSAPHEPKLLSVLEAWEDARHVLRAEVTREALGENVSEVRRNREVAALVELFALETGPLAVDLAALDVAAEHEHRVAMSVV